MPTVLQFRRGSTSQNNSFTGAIGEITYDTDKDVLRVHDGSTAGGFSMVSDASTSTLTNKIFPGPSPSIVTSSSDPREGPKFIVAQPKPRIEKTRTAIRKPRNNLFVFGSKRVIE